MKFCVSNLLVLVEIADRRIQLIGLGAGLLSQLLCLTGLGRSLQSLLIRLVCGALSLVDAGLCTGRNLPQSLN